MTPGITQLDTDEEGTILLDADDAEYAIAELVTEMERAMLTGARGRAAG